MVTRPKKPEGPPSSSSIEALAAQTDRMRELMLGDDTLALLHELRNRLGKDDVRIETLAGDLPDALMGRQDGDENYYRELITSMRSPVEDSIDSSVNIDKKRLAAVLSPVLGGMITRYLSAFSRQMMEAINHRLISVTSPRWWKSMIVAKLRGIPLEEISETYVHSGRLEEIVVLDRSREDIVAHVGGLGTDDGPGASLGSAFEELLDCIGEDSEAAPGGDAFAWRLADGRLGLVARGSHCSVLGIAEPGADPCLGTPVQACCDSVDTILDSDEEDGSVLAPNDGQRVRVGEAAFLALEAGSEQTNPPSQAPAVVLLFLLAIAALAGLGLFAWGKVRWARSVAALESEPGIRVIEHSQGFGSHRIHILADPLSKNPEDVLVAEGFKEGSIDIISSPFHSLEPQFVEARQAAEEEKRTGLHLAEQSALDAELAASQARLTASEERAAAERAGLQKQFSQILGQRLDSFEDASKDRDLAMVGLALDIPQEVSISRTGNELKAVGVLPVDGRNRLLGALSKLPWVGNIDAEELQVKAPPKEEIAEKIREIRIRFADAALDLYVPNDPGLETIAGLVIEATGEASNPPQIRLMGVPLRGKADKENALVALRRCRVVQERLEALGIASECFAAPAIAGDEALPGYAGVYVEIDQSE